MNIERFFLPTISYTCMAEKPPRGTATSLTCQFRAAIVHSFLGWNRFNLASRNFFKFSNRNNKCVFGTWIKNEFCLSVYLSNYISKYKSKSNILYISYIYIYTNLPVNAIVRPPHPRSRYLYLYLSIYLSIYTLFVYLVYLYHQSHIIHKHTHIYIYVYIYICIYIYIHIYDIQFTQEICNHQALSKYACTWGKNKN